MKGLTAKGTGNSRFLKTSLAEGSTWEQALALFRAGQLPIDLNGFNPAGIAEMGTLMNKETVLPDTLAAALGLPGDDPTVKDALAALHTASLKTKPVSEGGTGAETAAAARKNLGLGSVATLSTVPVSSGGTGLATIPANQFLTGNGTNAILANPPLTTMSKLGRGYTSCTTAASTAAKTAALGSFALLAGAMISVKFSYTNTAANPTLNVNGTGAKYIRNGQTGANATVGEIAGGVTAFLVYDGASWVLLNPASARLIGPLESTDWSLIDLISATGKAHEFWNIGDTKSITLNGVSYPLIIIGFNHDDLTSGGKAGITFQLNWCLNDPYTMNSSDTNVGGWNSCLMRNSTMVTLFNQLSADLRVVVKQVNKITAKGGGNRNDSYTLITSSDKLFLPSNAEVAGYGSYQASHSGEGTLYAYYAAGNRVLKNSSHGWSTYWERSPYASTDGRSFTMAIEDLGNNFGLASSTHWVSFCLCV